MSEEPRLPEISGRNVLVAIDGTPEAWDAVALGVQIVRAMNGRLTLLTVVVPAPAWTQVGLFASPADGTAEQVAIERLRELTDAIPDDVPVTTQLLKGDAAHLIAKRAEDGNHDLVVLAAHQHSPIGAAIESVQRRLLRCTNVPVLAIHRPHPKDDPAGGDDADEAAGRAAGREEDGANGAAGRAARREGDADEAAGRAAGREDDADGPSGDAGTDAPGDAAPPAAA